MIIEGYVKNIIYTYSIFILQGMIPYKIILSAYSELFWGNHKAFYVIAFKGTKVQASMPSPPSFIIWGHYLGHYLGQMFKVNAPTIPTVLTVPYLYRTSFSHHFFPLHCRWDIVTLSDANIPSSQFKIQIPTVPLYLLIHPRRQCRQRWATTPHPDLWDIVIVYRCSPTRDLRVRESPVTLLLSSSP